MSTKPRYWPTATEITDDVRENLAAGDNSHALRMMMDGVNRLRYAQREGRLEETVTEEPATVGDRRWDALIAGAIRYRLHEMGECSPDWTLKVPLETFWWPVAYSPSKAYIDMAHSPAELMRLGIFIDAREFEQA